MAVRAAVANETRAVTDGSVEVGPAVLMTLTLVVAVVEVVGAATMLAVVVTLALDVAAVSGEVLGLVLAVVLTLTLGVAVVTVAEDTAGLWCSTVLTAAATAVIELGGPAGPGLCSAWTVMGDTAVD